MFEILFFLIGVLNNALLIVIFVFRKAKNLKGMKTTGYIYLALAIPAAYAVLLAVLQNKAVSYTVFLIIFLAYLALEFLYDYVLKIPFRKNWKLLIPYLCLYIPMNYGFFVLSWKASLPQGIAIGVLLAAQIVMNVISHNSLPEQK